LELGAILDDANEQFEKAFATLRARAGSRFPLRTEVEVGHPAEHLVTRAEKEAVDLIVMGRRGHTAIARWMLGEANNARAFWPSPNPCAVHEGTECFTDALRG
jgi:nucleotide-binding universal stress UspA family protein